MNKYVVIFFCFLSFLTLDSCRRHRLTRNTGQTPVVTSIDSTTTSQPTSITSLDSTSTLTPVSPGIEEARTNVAEIDFHYLTAKSKISFKSQQQDIDNANVNIRVQKDSLIWLSISKLGLEAVRSIITPDSIVIVDKIHKEYSVYDFPTLSKRFNFAMNFELLQALIVGNLPLPTQPAQKIKKENDYLLLRQSEGKVMVENYIGEQDRKLKKLLVTEQPTKNTLRLDYDEFASLNNFLFPYTSLITLDYKSRSDGEFYQTLIRIKHSKVELVDKNPGFPFTIPASYIRRQ